MTRDPASKVPQGVTLARRTGRSSTKPVTLRLDFPNDLTAGSTVDKRFGVIHQMPVTGPE